MKLFSLLITGIALCTNLHAQTTVVIDAGHGGKDKGYVTKDGVTESSLTFKFAKALGAELEKHHVKVEYTSNEDEYVELATRAKKAQNTKNTYFISIHMESDENPLVHGQTIIVERNNENVLTDDFARVVATSMNPLGAVKIVKKDLVILRDGIIPSLVYSPGFISNPEDLKILQSPAYQQRVAIMLCQALIGKQ